MPGASVPQSAKQRLHLLALVLFLWLAAICGRLVQLQIIRYGDFVQRASRQQLRTLEVTPRRGVIYDRNGHELAMSISVDSIFAVPPEISDPANTARLLAKVLGGDPNEILARLKSSRTFCWIARKVDANSGERVRTLNLRGIYFQKEPKRFYPKRELAAQVLGYVGLDDEGLGGIERGLDARLRGRPGKMLISMDARRRWFGRVERQPDAGENVVLTIDEKIQYIAERELEAAMQETHAAVGTVIVQRPQTGEILALANRPTFNPNRIREVTPDALKNRAVSDIYEPGSTFKIVTLSGALEERLTQPEELIDCQMGAINIGGMRIRDHKKFGTLSVAEVLAHSSDVGAIKVGLRLGEARFDQYIRAFGFGSQTGVELPGETRGLTKPANRWSKVSIGAISMGQEIGISPLQLTSMISTIANDGVWRAAHILTQSGSPQTLTSTAAFHAQMSQNTHSREIANERRVISPLTAAEMKKMLEGVVLFGTGRKAILDGYTSAGKTGTAQKVDPVTGAYSRSKYVASFVGFAPVNNPAISIAVILDSAAGLHQGGQIAAPVFQRVAQQVLSYLNVPRDTEVRKSSQRLLLRASIKDDELAEGSPDRLSTALTQASGADSEKIATVEAPSVNLPAVNAPLAVAAAAKRSITVATPKSMPTLIPPPSHISSGTVVLALGEGKLVPSFIGQPLRGTIEMAQESGLEIDVIGSGIAEEQSPPPGSRLPAGAHVVVRFGR